MTDRPILFSAPMVRALLDGRKTQTRRLAWTQPKLINIHSVLPPKPTIWQSVKPGDRLWVRETWCAPNDQVVIYRANWRDDALARGLDNVPLTDAGIRWKPSIHMPREFSRLTLVVTDTKRERFHEISRDDAIAEGFAGGRLDDGFDERPLGDGWTISSPGTFCSAAGAAQIEFMRLYPDPIWDAYSSPECVALTFTVHACNIDQMRKAA